MRAPDGPTPHLNSQALQIRPSGIRVIADAAARRARAGDPVYPFHLGEPDFDTPEPIKEAAISALRAGEVHYPPNAGIAPLRQAIAADMQRRYEHPVGVDDIIVTVGACEAISLALLACLQPGDDVVVPTPCWPNYLQTPTLLGATVTQVPLLASDGFRFDTDRVLDAIGPRTRAVVINSPNNPTGMMIERGTLEALLTSLRKRGVWLIADEIYHDLIYTDGWTSVLEIARPSDPLIYINGFSKSYAMTGWRLGYVVGNGDVGRVMLRLHQALVTSVTSFAQHGALEAFEQRDAVESMRACYAERRDRVMDALRHANITSPAPEGAFYVFPKVPPPWMDGDTFAREVLASHGVAVVPGSVFGEAHADRFRLCFACADDLLDAGLDALRRAVDPAEDHPPAADTTTTTAP